VTAHRLVLGVDGGGPRWFVDGKPVHCGSELEVWCPNAHGAPGRAGAWLAVRFEMEGAHPALYFTVGQGTRLVARSVDPANEAAVWERVDVRWPVPELLRSKARPK